MVYISEDEACALLLLHKFNNIKINRNKLRSILKKNNISYHKSGPKNLMKSKKEMEIEVFKLAYNKISLVLQYYSKAPKRSILI